jgi:hypothetical protein
VLRTRYSAALTGNTDQCVVYLSSHDIAALIAGNALHTGLVADGLPVFLAVGDETDAQTERVLSVGKGCPV